MGRGEPFPGTKRKDKKVKAEEPEKRTLPPGMNLDHLSEQEKQTFSELYHIDLSDESGESADPAPADPDPGFVTLPMNGSDPVVVDNPDADGDAVVQEAVSEPVEETPVEVVPEPSDAEPIPNPDAVPSASFDKFDKKDKIIQKFKERNSKLAQDNDELNRRLKKLNESYSASSSSLNNMNLRLSEKDAEITHLSEKIKELERKIREDKDVITALTSRKNSSEEECNSLRSVSKDLEAANAAVLEKDAEIARLNGELERARANSRPLPSASVDPELIGSVVRRTESDLYSDLFSDGRYTVRLARDVSTLTFIPDVSGRAVCSNHTIRLPLLATYVGFGTPVTYRLYRDGAGMVARLDSPILLRSGIFGNGRRSPGRSPVLEFKQRWVCGL